VTRIRGEAWRAHRATGYRWWIERFRRTFEVLDPGGARGAQDGEERSLAAPAPPEKPPRARRRIQDVLGVGSEARMSRPGNGAGNWRWRLEPVPLRRPDLALQAGIQARNRAHMPTNCGTPETRRNFFRRQEDEIRLS
jgi:hypothetical protein